MEFTLKNAQSTATFSALGAELISWQAFGTEYLWQGNAQYWDGQSPLLFPFVGRFTAGKYRLHGQEHSMKIHGFARKKEFALEDSTLDSLTFLLEDDAETFAQYPFHFQLRVHYTLQGCRLQVAYEVLNLSDDTLIFGLGAHPGFCLPLEPELQFSDYYLEFPHAHQPRRVGLTNSCFLNGQDRVFPLEDGRRLPLQHSLFDNDAIVLADMAREVTLRSQKGTHGLTLRYEDFPYLGLWHTPQTQAPYLCIEPWCSLPARQDIVEEFACKSDLLHLPPGKSCHHSWEAEIF